MSMAAGEKIKMNEKAIAVHNELIDKYNKAKENEKRNLKYYPFSLSAAMYRDEQRKLAKVFERMFHKPINETEKILSK